jgi:hypothetical protein
LEFKEAQIEEELKLDFKHGFQSVTEHKKILGETQPFGTQTDTQVKKSKKIIYNSLLVQSIDYYFRP